MAAVALAVLLGACNESGSISPGLTVGDSVPRSNNLTVPAGGDWRQVSTLDTPADLYRWRIADLLQQGKPFLVVFGTPQHCTMCVDQLVRVAVMEEKYGDRFAFIHVDGYKDNAVWVEWGITGEPWTFVVNAKGRVSSVFPGQTELSVLEREVQRVLKEAV